MGSKADLIRIVDLAGRGKLRPVIAQVFKFGELPEAMARLEDRSVFGKVVLSAQCL